MKVLGGSPRYLRETLISPYAEGGAFAQAWLRANPGLKLGGLLERMPVSSEQVLHFEKYLNWDAPTSIDLSAAGNVVPTGWSPFFANTLGEFDLLLLFQTCEGTSGSAGDMASGWDGFRFEAYVDSTQEILLVGSSVWDSDEDAAEFCDGFSRVLGSIHDPREFSVVRNGPCVSFVIGRVDDRARARILEVLQGA